MTIDVPQHILDALTDVDMPRLPAQAANRGMAHLAGFDVPLYRSECVVVGSGAAGLRAAVELRRRDREVMVISQSAWGGTSACSGSDKQTLHTANTADQGDDYWAMANAISAGGAMDKDAAYVEAVGSGRMVATLQYLGLPLPQEALGGTLRYKTDHDEIGRATSCGPRTSRLMVRVLADEALRLNVPILNHTTAVSLLLHENAGGRRVVGLAAMRASDRSESNPFGLAVFACNKLILAAGGPGELYRDSVYPNGCFGALGLALDAGIELVNLTESQFGIGTRRESFPWNLSGTYVQSIPHVYSVDSDGHEHHFLADYYRTTQELASNLFRKGYQWPFHATRMLDFGSSLVDLAIYRESAAGRSVFMDFNRNPLPVPGDLPFSMERLDHDVADFLGKAGASQLTPIARLRHMNPLAIELYRRYKIDIAENPLEFAVNNQHMNGGIMVDCWGQTNLSGCYAIGEAAGTHGVTRPGGAALNAGQVFGTRAAEHIAGSRPTEIAITDDFVHIAEIRVLELLTFLRVDSPHTAKSVRAEVQTRMSEKAGLICDVEGITMALAEAQKLVRSISIKAMGYSRPAEAARALQWRNMAMASEAVLTALEYYVRNGGGSRGARAICDPNGELVPASKDGPLAAYRFRAEQTAHRDQQIVVWREGNDLRVRVRPNRKLDETAKSFFERDWSYWLTGQIYGSTQEAAAQS